MKHLPSYRSYGTQSATWCAASIAAALAFWACAGERGGDVASSGSATEASGSASAAAAPKTNVVEVSLDEYVIGMPNVLPPGRTTFRFRNVGFEEHNFQIRRDEEVLWNLEDPLNPGASMSVELDLEPGHYWVICPVSGHDGRGMIVEVTVAAEAGAAPASPP